MLKIHGDRSFKDTISFEELQEMAKRCSKMPEDSEREETRWLEKLGIPSRLVGSDWDECALHPLSSFHTFKVTRWQVVDVGVVASSCCKSTTIGRGQLVDRRHSPKRTSPLTDV